MVAHFPEALSWNDFRSRIVGSTLLRRMAMNEIENAVRAWPGAVDEVGPGHGTLWRNAGPQVAKPAGGAQLGKIGEQSFRHHALRQARIHAIDADNDDFLPGTA